MMAKYKVTINALLKGRLDKRFKFAKLTELFLVTKTIEVEASDENNAEEKANELFTIYRDKSEERYEQETVSIEEAA